MERKFLPGGGEWLYVQLFTGIKTSDIILQEIISPMVIFMNKENLIIKWFFIRYSDPKPHLRIRFQLTCASNFGVVLEYLNQLLRDFVNSGEVSHISIDSYIREIERYGESRIECAEQMFCNSSKLAINFLNYDEEEKIMVSMFYFDNILSKIKLSDQEKLKWMEGFDKSFKMEFNADTRLNGQLSKKFRSFKPKYFHFMKSSDFLEIRNIIITMSVPDAERINEYNLHPFLSIPDDFFQSIFHMHVNRTFISNQRLYEMIIYDYMKKYYKTLIGSISQDL